MKLGFKHLLLASTLAGILAPAALAQDNPFLRGRHTAVDERRQEEYDPEIVRVGTFDMSSSLSLDAEYNDNVFASPNNEVDDTIIRIRPEAELRSTWTVHQLVAGLSFDHKEYVSNDSETATDYDAFVAGRLDATRAFQLTGRADIGHETEERYNPGSTGTVEPAKYDRAGVAVGALFRSDRLQFEGQVGRNEDEFENTPVFGFRDVTQTFVSGRASYAISPDVAVFVQARETENEYAAAGSNRDGTTSTIQVGTSFELAAPFRGEISIGQVEEDKDSPLQADTDGLSLDARVLWFPTQLTTVTFSGNAGIADPGIIQAASATYSNYTVHVDHELLRNVLVYGEFGFGNYDFEAPPASGFAREDEFTDFRVGAAYKLNKHAHLEAGYRMHTQDTTQGTGVMTDTDIDQHVFSVGIKIFP